MWTWLAVSRLRQHCALHMKQDMGLYPLGEFTSSEPPPPPPPPTPHLPPETSSPFSWRPDIPSSSGGFSGRGWGWFGSKRGSFSSCTFESGSQISERNPAEPNQPTTRVLSPGVGSARYLFSNEPRDEVWRHSCRNVLPSTQHRHKMASALLYCSDWILYARLSLNKSLPTT